MQLEQFIAQSHAKKQERSLEEEVKVPLLLVLLVKKKLSMHLSNHDTIMRRDATRLNILINDILFSNN